MKRLRALGDRWPFIALTLTTMLVVVWVGLTLQSVFAPQAIRPPVGIPNSNPSPNPTLIPSLANTAPLVAPTLPTVPIAPLPNHSVSNASGVPTPLGQKAPIARVNPLPQSRYGHLPYAEDPSDRLVSVGSYGTGANQRTESLDKDAAATFAQMKTDAASAGVNLVAISGFRSIADQVKLFERQIQRQGSETAAARLSAPDRKSVV